MQRVNSRVTECPLWSIASGNKPRLVPSVRLIGAFVFKELFPVFVCLNDFWWSCTKPVIELAVTSRMCHETSLEERSSAIKRPAAEGEGGEEEEPKKKLSFGINKPQDKSSLAMSVPAKKPLSGISIKLGQTQQKAAAQTGVSALKPKVGSAASVFGDEDDDDDEEEMPPEARMRMKNIGRDTPTSAGPNSFGKTRMGFCDSKKIYEKQLKEVQDKASRVEDAV